jgi:biotin carboxyl carrier protein
MRARVTIGDRVFEVEVGDTRERPILAVVDGVAVEVWPEEPARPAPAPSEGDEGPRRAAKPSPAPGAGPAAPGKTVRSPLPGVVASIAVQVGTAASIGQELVVIEAMKMKNAIRASRAGQIAAVHVSVGQHVRHNDPIVDFAD